MSSIRGFTLIEVMIVVVIVAILVAVGYPSYREHVARGQRSEGQQALSEVAQRQEQFLLDRRQYATTYAGLGLTWPPTPGIKYAVPVFTPIAGPPAGYAACIDPIAGSYLAARGDGSLCVNNLGQRWRQPTGGNTTFDGTGAGECEWENRSCKITGES